MLSLFKAPKSSSVKAPALSLDKDEQRYIDLTNVCPNMTAEEKVAFLEHLEAKKAAKKAAWEAHQAVLNHLWETATVRGTANAWAYQDGKLVPSLLQNAAAPQKPKALQQLINKYFF